MQRLNVFPFSSDANRLPARRAFSLVEVLLAVFILGIGLIMVAAVFPVGANWTRQTTEESVGQTVAQAALGVIKQHYGPGGDLHMFLAPDYLIMPSGGPPPTPNFTLLSTTSANHNTILQQGYFNPAQPAPPNPFTLQALPGFVQTKVTVMIGGFPTQVTSNGISASERAYQFGSNSPFPASNWQGCTYFWTALARLNPTHRNSNPAVVPPDPYNFILPKGNYKYDVYILVFRKGDPQQKFTTIPAGATEIPLLRDLNGDGNIAPYTVGAATYDETLLPSIFYAPYNAGNYDPVNNNPPVKGAVPPIGQYGIGAQSGTVFRQVSDSTVVINGPGPGGAMPRPDIARSGTPEQIIFSPPPDGANESASPLIYIYQTTLSF